MLVAVGSLVPVTPMQLLVDQHWSFVRAHRFFAAAKTDNRVAATLNAYRSRTEWPYSFALETAVGYLKAVDRLNTNLLNLLSKFESKPDLKALSKKSKLLPKERALLQFMQQAQA